MVTRGWADKVGSTSMSTALEFSVAADGPKILNLLGPAVWNLMLDSIADLGA
jgi:hypothetical protein